MNLTIDAYLKEAKEKCNFSKRFIKEWMQDKDNLHPKAQDVIVNTVFIDKGTPSIHLYNGQGEELLMMEGKDIKPFLLQEHIVNYKEEEVLKTDYSKYDSNKD